jgi:enamine deaminase RidA (YjgF/YER057c/UK114 family)
MSRPPREVITSGRAWPPGYTYVPALRVGNLIFLSGTTATDDGGHVVAPGDIVEQTRQIFRKFERLLEAVGATCDDIVQTTDYITTIENYRKTAEVRREFFKHGFPAATGVIVAGLLREGAVIEISAVAVVPDESGAPATTKTWAL